MIVYFQIKVNDPNIESLRSFFGKLTIIFREVNDLLTDSIRSYDPTYTILRDEDTVCIILFRLYRLRPEDRLSKF